MKTIVARIRRGKTLNYLSAVIFALALALALPSFASDWTDAAGNEYTALKYLKGNATGSSYGGPWLVLTNITVSCTDIIKMKFNVPAGENGWSQGLWCSRKSTTQYFMGLFYSKNSTRQLFFYRYNSTSKGHTTSIAADTDYSVMANYNTREFTVNGTTETLGLSSTSFSDLGPLMLFATHADKTTAGYSTAPNGNRAAYYCYNFQIYNAQTNLTHNLMPATNLTAQTVGLYDTVTQTFYTPDYATYPNYKFSVAEWGSDRVGKKWTGLGGDNKMSTAANWANNDKPGAGDDIDFTIAVPFAEIDADINATFGKVYLGAADLPSFTGSLTATDINDLTRMQAYDAATAGFAFTLAAPSGQDFTWDGGAAANWWATDVWTCNNVASSWFDNNNAIFTTANATVTLDEDATADSLAFNADATVSGSSTLTVPTVSVAPGVAATISAPTAGALEKTGAGTLTLGSSRSETTTLTEGTLALSGTASLNWSSFTLGTDSAKPVTLDFGETATLASVPATWYIGNIAGITSTVVKNGGAWTASTAVRVGSAAGTASFYHKGGSLTTARLMVGDDNTTGHAGTGYAEISGGTVTSTGTSNLPIIGCYSDGTVVVTNSGRFVCNGSLYVGYTESATGILTVVDGGIASIAKNICICGSQATATGILNIKSGGTLSSETVYRTKSGGATVNFDGGTFKKASGTGNIFPAEDNASAVAVTVSANGGTIDNNSLDVTIPCIITGAGGMTLVGSGTTTIATNQSYLGTTTVSSGTTLSVSGGVTLAGPVVFEAGAALDIAGYDGTTPLAATAITFPESGTVPLTLDGGAFPAGTYTILAATGVTAADGEKFAPSVGELDASWSVADGALVLTVTASSQTWNGAAGESVSWNSASWTSGSWMGGDAVFNTEGAIASVDLDVSANAVQFNAGATVNGTGTLTTYTVFVDEGKEATINTPTAGTLEKTGAGTLTLTQDRADATTLTAGTLKMDGASVAGLTLGEDGGAAVVFDYGGQTLTADPSTYLVTGSEVTLTNGTFSSSGSFQIRDNTKIPSVLTIAKDASLVQASGTFYMLKDNGRATINVQGGTLGSASGSGASYLQHGSDVGRLNVNVTEGGRWEYPSTLYALCYGTKGTHPSLYMTFSDSTFIVGGSFLYGNNTTRPTSATGVFAATNSVISVANSFYIGYDANDNKAGSLTADFEHCIVTAKSFAVYCDHPLNNALFNGTTFVFGGASGTFNASDGADNWITVGADGITIDTQAYSATLNANLGGSGAVAKTGSGTLAVAVSQTATAALNVNAGTLAVNGGVSIARPTTIADGATLSIAGTATASFDTLSLAAGSTLGITDYTAGVTPLAATSATLPESGTVALTLDGGAFEKGVYAISGTNTISLAQAEGKFVPSTGDLEYSWSVSADGELLLLVGDIYAYSWTGLAGDGKFATGANWVSGVAPSANSPVDFSSISSATAIDMDGVASGTTFGEVTMGEGVITFSGSLSATSFSDTSKIAVDENSTVTLDGNLEFGTNVVCYICHTVAAGGTFAVTGDIVGTANQTANIAACETTSIEGVISAKGLVNDCALNLAFGLSRGLADSHVQWLIGEHGISGGKDYATGSRKNTVATITAATNFTVSAKIAQYRNLFIDTAGWMVTLGDGTSGGIFHRGEEANLTTVTGSGTVVVNYDVNDLSSAASSRTNAFTVATGATLTLNPGANIGFGDLTVQDDGTLEIQSGTTTFGNLTVEENAILGFSFTDRRNAPVLALYDGAEVTAQDPFTVKVSGTVWPSGGEKILTTCGGFESIPLTLSAVGEAARWAKPDRLSVNAAGNLVLDVKPMGTMILFR